jgi:serine phosphatase RsbU (regulator of sigma subunit)
VAADVPPDRLLGVAPDGARRSTLVSLAPGDSLCLYTDGLVERRPRGATSMSDLVAENTDRLAGALAHAGDPEMACIRALAEVVGDHVAEDDIAILVARVDGP